MAGSRAGASFSPTPPPAFLEAVAEVAEAVEATQSIRVHQICRVVGVVDVAVQGLWPEGKAGEGPSMPSLARHIGEPRSVIAPQAVLVAVLVGDEQVEPPVPVVVEPHGAHRLARVATPISFATLRKRLPSL